MEDASHSSLIRELQVGTRPTRSGRGVLLMGGAVLALAGLYFLKFGRVNQDEGWYLYAARLLYEGQLPYRDFAFFQSPLVPILYGIPQLASPGIETGRWTSLVIGAFTLGLALRLAFERGGATAVAFVVGGIVGAPLALWALVSTRTEPLSALCLVLAACCLARPHVRRRHRTIAVLASVFAIATRISSAPAAMFIAFWALRDRRLVRSDRVRILTPAFVLALLVSALVFSGGLESAWVNLVEVQSERHAQLQPQPAVSASFWISTRFAFLPRLVQQFGVATALSLIATIGFVCVWLRRGDLRDGDGVVAAGGPLALLALLAWAPNLMPLVLYPVYLVSVLPLLLVLGGWGLAAVSDSWLASGSRRKKAVVVAFAAGLVLAQGHTFLDRRNQWSASQPTDLDALRSVADELRSILPANAELLTLDTYLAVEARRRVPPGFEMGLFSWFPRRPAADGERLGLLTPDRLRAAVASPAVGAVALSDEALGVLTLGRFSGFQPRSRLSERELWQLYPALQRFGLAHVVPSFGPRNAPLYLLLAKNSEARFE